MARRRSNYEETCWGSRSSLELALIGVVLAVIVFCIVLVVLLTIKIPPSATPNQCTTPICTMEATQISQKIDPTINPCDDFYKFSCGNLLTNAHGDEKLGAFLAVQENVDRQLIELYSEPIGDQEHHMVVSAKKLFRACLDEADMEKDGLKSIKEVLRLLGGWPIVEGPSWDETKFDWLQASFRLRKLGFRFSIFLDLLVIDDPMDNNRFMFEVAVPIERQFLSSMDFETNDFMAEVAVMLGAEPTRAVAETAEIIRFAEELQQRNYSPLHIEKIHRRFSVSEFNQIYGFNFNWLEFINTIAQPLVRITQDDLVIFPQSNIFSNWLYTVSKTPKRIQANYMMWKVIEDVLPYLTETLRNHRNNRRSSIPKLIENKESRIKFCLRETQERFYPSPINVMYARKYLSMEKQSQVEKMAVNIKTRFIEILGDVDWMNEKDKQNLVEKARDVALIIGAPEGYFDNQVLDDLNTDMKEIADNSVLSLLSQADRNHKSNLYKRTQKSRNETKLSKWYLGTLSDYLLYDVEDNVMRIPVTILQGVFFNEARPNYLNYGGIGTGIAHEFAKLFGDEAVGFSKDGQKVVGWSSKTLEAFRSKTTCMTNDLQGFKLKKNSSLPGVALREALALKVSYDAYQNWIKGNGREDRLVATKYSPNELFWVAAAFTMCQPTTSYEKIFQSSEESEYFSYLVFGSMRNVEEFAKDMKCEVGWRMNPKNKCRLFN